MCQQYCTLLLKTLWEKEKLLKSSNFSYSQCFLPFWKTFIKFTIVICKLLVWKSLNFVVLEKRLTLYQTILTFNDTEKKKKSSEHIVGKGENIGKQHFLLFPTLFSTHSKRNFCFYITLLCHLQML